MPNPYVQSNFPRVPGDYYPTLDPRCVWGFLEHFPVPGVCVDPCSPQGSGIVSELLACHVQARCVAEYTDDFEAESIVCNPPYKRGLVDAVIWNGIERVEVGGVRLAAYLLRSNFAFAKSRTPMFRDNPYYFGEVKLLFRPWWSEDHSQGPIHNFVWHVFSSRPRQGPPVLLDSLGVKP